MGASRGIVLTITVDLDGEVEIVTQRVPVPGLHNAPMPRFTG